MTADQSPLFPRASTDRLRTVLAARLPADAKWVAWIDGVVGELAGCVVEDPRLAQIRALCDDVTSDEFGFSEEETAGAERIAYEVLTILGAPPVDVTPAQGIDLGRVHGLMCNVYAGVTSPSAAVDAVLAIVRPVEGVVLTPEDAALFAALLRENVRMMMRNDSTGRDHDYIEHRSALAAQLEAAS